MTRLPRFVGVQLFFKLLLLCLLSLFIGCSPGEEEGRGTDTNQGEGALSPSAGGTVVIALESEPDALNSLIRRSAAAGHVIDLISDPLPDLGEDLEWFPCIASSWEIAPDKTSITYRLRPWTWSDGTPLTARDVVVTCSLFMNPEVASPHRGRFRDVDSVTAPDPATVIYRFKAPVADPLMLTYHGLLPAHVVEGLDPGEVMSWEFNREPLSCGPFSLEKWEPGRSLSLVRNDLYSGEAALLDRVFIRFIPEAAGRVVALETGEVDFVGDLSPADARRLADHPQIRVDRLNGRHYYYLNWNLMVDTFADPLTRKALSHAVDRERMIETLQFGYGEPAVGPVAPVMWNFDHSLEADAYDPDLARELLSRAGWQDEDGDGVLELDGEPLEFEILTKVGDPVRENGAVILRENFRSVGARVSIRTMELAAALELLNQGDFTCYYGSFRANLYGDPSAVVHSGSVNAYNKGHYANSTVDSLLAVALGTADRAAALPVWHRLQVLLQEDQPSAFLFYTEKIVGVGPRLQDVRPHLLSPMNNLSSWWIPADQRKYRTSPAGP